jgi:hypothetical protein
MAEARADLVRLGELGDRAYRLEYLELTSDAQKLYALLWAERRHREIHRGQHRQLGNVAPCCC